MTSDEPPRVQAAAEAFRDWVKKLELLEWIPWEDDTGLSIHEEPTGWYQDQVNPANARLEIEMQRMAMQQMGLAAAQKSVEQLLRERAEVRKAERNRFIALRLLYEEAGWLYDETEWQDEFDRSKFRKFRDDWNWKVAELSNPYVHGPNAARWWQYEHGQALRDMFSKAIGPFAYPSLPGPKLRGSTVEK